MILESMAEKQRNIFLKKGVETDLDLIHMFPTRYFDFSELSYISKDKIDEYGCFKGTITKIRKNDVYKFVTCDVVESTTNQPFCITTFGDYEYKWLCKLVDKEIYVCGRLKQKEYKNWQGQKVIYYDIANPIAISEFQSIMKVHRIYPKHKGMSTDFKEKAIKSALIQANLEETLPSEVKEQYHLMQRTHAYNTLHYPKSIKEVKEAISRLMYEDIIYFFVKMKLEEEKSSKTSSFITHIVGTSISKVLNSLSFDLTEDQKKVVKEMINITSTGNRLNALVQGDVGCGKSIVAYLMMLAFADNGYQSVLMAPNQVLFYQHYNDLKKYAALCGYEVACLYGNQKAKEKKAELEKIRSGKAALVVGTHAVISENVEFSNLALAVIDEEHKFGVDQREALMNKAEKGVHTISFSATPIPRSFANTIYGNTTIYDIKSMPNGRKQIRTKVISEEYLALNMAEKVISEGSQVYVVCPLIDTEDDTVELRSVKQTAKVYEERLHIPIGILTGKESATKKTETLDKFKSGELKVLVATTVVEVGVNVPNATLITINDAYMFGLAQLHQLRGRVGRGEKQGYCILLTDKEAERLAILEQTTDGFKVAEEDLKLRGAGNLLGNEQSGNHRFIQEVMMCPEIARNSKEIANILVEANAYERLVSQMEARSEKVYFNITKAKIFD